MGIEKLSDFVYSKTKRNKSLNKGGPTIMKKKKLISLLLVASMAFSLAACGSSGGDDKDADKGGDEKTLKVAAVETCLRRRHVERSLLSIREISRRR